MERQAVARCALALATALLPASIASAAPGDRPSADARFESYDQSGCVNTDVAVFVRGATVASSGSAADLAKVHLVISVLNECEDVAVLKAEGRANLRSGEFQLGPALRSAELNATIPMSVRGSKEKFDADVALTWVAVEAAIATDARAVPTEVGRFERARTPVRRSIRLSKASGTISDGIENFTPEPSSDASISLVSPKGN
jgi:hypothetical protein